MSTTNDGGPAFPTVPKNHGYDESQGTGSGPGMTLRDWFAGQALVALPHIGCGCDLNTEEAALAAYQFADAMLKARDK